MIWKEIVESVIQYQENGKACNWCRLAGNKHNWNKEQKKRSREHSRWTRHMLLAARVKHDKQWNEKLARDYIGTICTLKCKATLWGSHAWQNICGSQNGLLHVNCYSTWRKPCMVLQKTLEKPNIYRRNVMQLLYIVYCLIKCLKDYYCVLSNKQRHMIYLFLSTNITPSFSKYI